MESSSSSSIHMIFRYDVFISFGEDTRKPFVDHLYRALRQHGIETFTDDNNILRKRKRIDNELIESIQESKIYIIVFSQNYASSSRCLDELVKIMDCHKKPEHTAYPVFYDVTPSDVRKQRGSVGKAFSKHEREEDAGKWRRALKEAAELGGWELGKTADGSDAQAIKRIVEVISLELRSIHSSIDKMLIGMKPRLVYLESDLAMDLNNVRMIGIEGVGGSGKTTLARAIFDRVSIQFEGASFIENVREAKASFSGLTMLQKQALSDLLNDQGIKVTSVSDGKDKMKRMLCHRKVLLVLDDVDHIDQLEALAPDHNWFKPGSRIIITTRDWQVLHGVDIIHHVSLLSNEEAVCLFSRYAFGKDFPIQGYKELSGEVVYYATGLPLTIKVLASFLCDKNANEWDYALESLKTIPLHETLKKLELSCISLEDDYQEIFLDVACFMVGWEKDKAIRLLESSGFHARNGLSVLKQKSLITIDSDGVLGMHCHMEEMGKNIVRRLHRDDPRKHSRLWIQEEIEYILAKDMSTDATEAIVVDAPVNISSPIVTIGFGKMKKLRALDLVSDVSDDYNVKFEQVAHSFPDALRFLSWVGYPHWSLPKTFGAFFLVRLEMPYSRIEQLWEEGERKVLDHLRFLDLRFSSLRTLDARMTPNLERLDLENCKDLIEVHAPIGCLERLDYLNLSACRRMESFSFIKHLESLEVLCLTHLFLKEFPDIIPEHHNSCLLELRFRYNNIVELPSSIANLQKLVYLDLHSCIYLRTLPGSICGLRHLGNLQLHDCILEELPEDLGQLECLEELNLSFTRIKHLPDSFCKLKHLKTLNLTSCWSLEKLHEDLGSLECLENLILTECTHVRDIPDSICHLKHLRYFSVSGCIRLEKLPKELGCLVCLEVLDVKDTFIRHLPSSISLLKGLKIYGPKSGLQLHGSASMLGTLQSSTSIRKQG